MKRLCCFFLIVVCIVLSACSDTQIEGNGKVITQKRSVSDFGEIEANGNFVISVNNGQSMPSVYVKTDENIEPYVLTALRDDKLTISLKKGYNIKPSLPIQVMVNMKSLVSASVKGANKFLSNNLSGDHFKLEMQGTGDSVLKGEVNSVSITSKGASNVNARGLKADTVRVNINGVSKVAVNVSHRLSVYINGLGQVMYLGHPPLIDQEIYAGGKLVRGQ